MSTQAKEAPKDAKAKTLTGRVVSTKMQKTIAVEISIELEDYGRILRIIEVPG